MKEQYLDAFLNAFDFPDKAKEAIKNTYSMLVALGKAQALFDCVEDFSADRCTYNDGIERIRALAKETDTHEYTLILLYLIYGIFASFLINGLGLILLDYTDFEYVARINSLFSSITTMSLPFTSFITGIILRYIEIREFFLGIGVIILILSIVGRKIVVKGEYL